jgi:multiple sugar transport system permease protein
MTVTTRPERIAAGGAPGDPSPRGRRGPRPPRVLLHLVLAAATALWVAPIAYALYTSLRPYSDTAEHGYVSLARSLTLDNYITAFTGADLPHYFLNTMLVAVPAIVVTLLLASFVAFGISRYSWRLNVPLLILFTAGNLLPHQVIITPLYRMFLEIPLPEFMSESEQLYDSYWGLIAIHVAVQMGFCVFVLSNYMRTIPVELSEAATMDGASLLRQYRQVILPLCRPPIAALATLEFTWIYNDFFWPLVLMPTGEKRPIMAALANLRGEYFVDNNLVAAGALLTAVPTVVVFFLLQKQFVNGLTMGATKG